MTSLSSAPGSLSPASRFRIALLGVAMACWAAAVPGAQRGVGAPEAAPTPEPGRLFSAAALEPNTQRGGGAQEMAPAPEAERLFSAAALEPHAQRGGGAPEMAPTPEPERPYLAAALEAGRWLRSVAVEAEGGLTWPADSEDPESVVPNLYYGSPGVVLFFLELARATGDEAPLKLARRGADHLLATLPRELGPGGAGFYTGVAGVGFALAETARATGDDRYRRGALAAVELIGEAARPTGAGVEWEGGVNDIISGTAGTGLFLLYAQRELDAPGALTLAEAAGRRLQQLAVEAEGGLSWPMSADYPRTMPNFSHGTAGVAYFLAELSAATGDREPLEAALAGARRLTRIAHLQDGGCLIPHHFPGGEDLFYLSWCHGPAGTGRLFHRLHQLTGDPEWRTWLDRAVQALEASGIPEERTPGFWNNVGQCCGSAGVGELLLGVDRARGTAEHRPLTERLADDLLARATPTASGLRWVQAEHRVHPELLVAQTGLMQGAAGIGLFLLHLDAAEQGHPPTVTLPDSPF